MIVMNASIINLPSSNLMVEFAVLKLGKISQKNRLREFVDFENVKCGCLGVKIAYVYPLEGN